LFPNAATDLTRSKAQLVLENASLRQQLITLQCQVNRPAPTPRDGGAVGTLHVGQRPAVMVKNLVRHLEVSENSAFPLVI
jgi:hypothetical protein